MVGTGFGAQQEPFQTASSMASVVTSLQEGFEFGQAVGFWDDMIKPHWLYAFRAIWCGFDGHAQKVGKLEVNGSDAEEIDTAEDTSPLPSLVKERPSEFEDSKL
jgi:hypothetical protein